MKKVVLELDLVDEKIKSKAMKRISSLAGVESISIGKDKRMTVIGDIDPVSAVEKLKKLCNPRIVSVGPKEDPKMKKDNNNNEGGKKDDGNKKKEENNNVAVMKAAAYYYPPPPYGYQYYPYPPPSPYHHSIEEDPTRCVIC